MKAQTLDWAIHKLLILSLILLSFLALSESGMILFILTAGLFSGLIYFHHKTYGPLIAAGAPFKPLRIDVKSSRE
ncbi:hypothetical protein [Deinococcus frigens]|uniref:hypothetical protein n=1 Tax=Deinococcus frigens TaxID=249403 RepID=UPI000496D9F5|nr:hypothetical protein [Deinococcus frigens]